jgi:cephalosporin hydroxylase
MFTPDDLKRAAAAERHKIESRVKGEQGGVATYFDVFLCRFLDGLAASESVHGWNANPQARRWNPFRARHRARNPKYVAKLQWLVAYLSDQAQGRLVQYDTRRRPGSDRSDIRSPERMMSQGKAECLNWKGMPLFKSVFDFAILPMLVWELKPASVFEIGSGTGASACWMADVLAACGLDSWVYSADLNPIGASHPRVRFVAGDCMSPESLFGAELLRSAPHPYLVVEDAHKNVRDVLLYLDGFLMQGDYLFVEDSLEKGDALNAFLSERPDRYRVDTRYTDFFGRNATSAIDSILVRV